MRQKRIAIVAGVLILLVGLCGCTIIQKPGTGKTYFDLEVLVPGVDQPTGCRGEDAFLVKEFFIDSAFDSHSFVLRISKNEYTSDYFSEFVTYPAKLITEKIAGALCGATHYRSSLFTMDQTINKRLSGKITRLYGDYQDAEDPRAVMEIRIIMEKKRDSRFQVVSSRTYLAREPVSSREPGQLVAGWSTGLSKILEQVILEIQGLDP